MTLLWTTSLQRYHFSINCTLLSTLPLFHAGMCSLFPVATYITHSSRRSRCVPKVQGWGVHSRPYSSPLPPLESCLWLTLMLRQLQCCTACRQGDTDRCACGRTSFRSYLPLILSCNKALNESHFLLWFSTQPRDYIIYGPLVKNS